MHVLCVLNPGAAGGLASERWPDVSAMVQALGATYDLLSLVPGRSIPDQVTDYLETHSCLRFDAVAGVGGDGTHSGIINGMMTYRNRLADRTLPPYAFIPLGTGNDIAKSLGVRIRDEYSAKDLRRAVSAVVHGADYALDLGLIDGVYFADALTVGLDSGVLKERNANKRLIENIPVLRHLARGRLLYTYSLGTILFRHALSKVEVVVDGHPWYEGPMINLVVNNTRIYAGDFDFSANAFADDGLLDVVLFADQRDYLARYLLAIRHNPASLRQLSEELNVRARHVQGRRISISVDSPQSAQVDGEERPDSNRFEVSVVQKALRIKTPVEPI